jgi:uncharacterized protein with HEPN domain
MSRSIQQRLHDVLESCEAITKYIAGQNFDDYMQNELVRDGVERRLEIIGEALNRARQLDPDLVYRIPELHDVVGLRNRLAHGYESSGTRFMIGFPRLSYRLRPYLISREPFPIVSTTSRPRGSALDRTTQLSDHHVAPYYAKGQRRA